MIDETQAARHLDEEIGDGVTCLSLKIHAFAESTRKMALIEAQTDAISQKRQVLLPRLRGPQ